jgi:DNA-directed RNA polymerase specialized sigma24 family protein
MSRNSEMSMRDVRNLYLRCGEPARNLATELLGDPFQGEKVARKAFLDLLGCNADRFEPGPMLDAWMHEEVVRLCLMRTGNIEVADWEEYQLKHEDEKPKSRRAKDAPQEDTRSERAAALCTPSAATRKARAQIEARKDLAPSASRSPPVSFHKTGRLIHFPGVS